MDNNLATITDKFLAFLDEECQYLERIKIFLAQIPEMIAGGAITQAEFQNFLENFEVETARYLFEKNHYKDTLANLLKIPAGDVTFKLLTALGFPQFGETGRHVLRLGNEIKTLMVKIAVFQSNFNRLHAGFKRLNAFLHQSDYSARGAEPRYVPGRNFYMEA